MHSPSAQQAGEAGTAEGLVAWAQTRGGRVLVVDDSATNRLVAAGLLSRVGFEVLLACDGAEAVTAVRESAVPPDAVLMDVAMPDMDGVTATETIRRLGGERANVPIIAFTAHGLPEDRSRCFAAGMNDFLLKPVDRTGLLATLRRWLPPAAA